MFVFTLNHEKLDETTNQSIRINWTHGLTDGHRSLRMVSRGWMRSMTGMTGMVCQQLTASLVNPTDPQTDPEALIDSAKGNQWDPRYGNT